MKITIDFENGMQTTVKPENLSIGDMKDLKGVPHVSIAFKTDAQTVPFLFFKNLQLATEQEVAARAFSASPLNKLDPPTPHGSLAKLAAAAVPHGAGAGAHSGDGGPKPRKTKANLTA